MGRKSGAGIERGGKEGEGEGDIRDRGIQSNRKTFLHRHVIAAVSSSQRLRGDIQRGVAHIDTSEGH